MIYYLHKLLQLKYPVHVNAITMSRVEEILQEHSSIALDYQEEIRKWANADYYEANVKRIQLPYVQAATSTGLTGELHFCTIEAAVYVLFYKLWLTTVVINISDQKYS